MAENRICPQCGAPIGEEESRGLCPQCILRGVLSGADHHEVPTEDIGSADATACESEEVAAESIGPYRLLRLLGRGGFGEVYLAEQRSPVRRKVALKILKRGMDTRQVVARFEAERQVLALMDHPNIAKVFDAGETDDGRPYFVMELVEGELATLCVRMHALDVAEILRLFREVCFAVQHAHQKGVIHRDLKPSNVLITMVDGVLRPKVIDFGIAKATEGFLTDGTLHTGPFQLLGTPEYMSPEQVELGGLRIDTRSDVYALGVLLYELLTGTTPLRREEVLQMTQDELIRRVRQEIPEPPRVRMRSGDSASLRRPSSGLAVAGAGAAPGRLDVDLDWIVMKALEKEPQRRYQSVAELGEDLDRYLAGRPVHARAPSRVYRLRKYTQRNRGFCATVAGIGVLAVLGAGGVLMNTARSHRDRLRVAEAAQLPVVVEQGSRLLWFPPLRAELQRTAEDPLAKADTRMRASWALLAKEPGRANYLAEYILSAALEEVRVLRPVAAAHGEVFRNAAVKVLAGQSGENQWLEESLQKSRARSGRVLRAAAVLALTDPGNAAWEGAAKSVSDALCAVNSAELGEWSRWLAPARQFLDPSLRELFRQENRPLSSNAAAVVLATFQGRDLPSKFELIREASPSQLTPALIENFAQHGEEAIGMLSGDLESTRFAMHDEEAMREELAREQANSGIALMLCGRSDLVWKFLGKPGAEGDESVHTHLIHGLAAGGVDPREVLRGLEAGNARTSRAVLIALGEYHESEFPPDLRARLLPRIEAMAADPDPGLHSAALWLARQWRLDVLPPVQPSSSPVENLAWARNSLGQDMLTVRAPAVFRSWANGASGADRFEEFRIDHSFAIGMLEVTEADYDMFLKEFSGQLAWALDPEERRSSRGGGDLSAAGVVEVEAKAFCVWLSEREGLEEEQQCYEVAADRNSVTLRGDLTRRSGYRLPLEIEWEFAYRAGSATKRAFGSHRERLSSYEVFGLNSGGQRWAPGSLRPNGYGLFDMLGNLAEWCHAAESGGTWLRGGSFLAAPESTLEVHTRSKDSGNVPLPVVGFRVARTLPP